MAFTSTVTSTKTNGKIDDYNENISNSVTSNNIKTVLNTATTTTVVDDSSSYLYATTKTVPNDGTNDIGETTLQTNKQQHVIEHGQLTKANAAGLHTATTTTSCSKLDMKVVDERIPNGASSPSPSCNATSTITLNETSANGIKFSHHDDDHHHHRHQLPSASPQTNIIEHHSNTNGECIHINFNNNSSLIINHQHNNNDHDEDDDDDAMICNDGLSFNKSKNVEYDSINKDDDEMMFNCDDISINNNNIMSPTNMNNNIQSHNNNNSNANDEQDSTNKWNHSKTSPTSQSPSPSGPSGNKCLTTMTTNVLLKNDNDDGDGDHQDHDDSTQSANCDLLTTNNNTPTTTPTNTTTNTPTATTNTTTMNATPPVNNASTTTTTTNTTTTIIENNCQQVPNSPTNSNASSPRTTSSSTTIDHQQLSPFQSFSPTSGSISNMATGTPTTTPCTDVHSIAEYLQQLLKDRSKMAAFPGSFFHADRLVDAEIARIRASLFQIDGEERKPMILPEPCGTVINKSTKVYVPVDEHPDFNFVGRILGPRGMTAKQLEQETGCKIMIRGRGSMRDKKREEQIRGKPNWEHLSDKLHVLITCEDTENRANIKLQRAIDEVKKLLVPITEGEDELKKRQLMELAIINGTYRDTTQRNASMVTSNVKNAHCPSQHHLSMSIDHAHHAHHQDQLVVNRANTTHPATAAAVAAAAAAAGLPASNAAAAMAMANHHHQAAALAAQLGHHAAAAAALHPAQSLAAAGPLLIRTAHHHAHHPHHRPFTPATAHHPHSPAAAAAPGLTSALLVNGANAAVVASGAITPAGPPPPPAPATLIGSPDGTLLYPTATTPYGTLADMFTSPHAHHPHHPHHHAHQYATLGQTPLLEHFSAAAAAAAALAAAGTPVIDTSTATATSNTTANNNGTGGPGNTPTGTSTSPSINMNHHHQTNNPNATSITGKDNKTSVSSQAIRVGTMLTGLHRFHPYATSATANNAATAASNILASNSSKANVKTNGTI